METAVPPASTKAAFISDRARWTEGILPLVLLLCFLIATTLGLYALSFLRTMLVTERGRELAMNAAAVADTLDRVLFERFRDIRLFANDGVLREGSPAEKSGRLIAATDSLPAQGTQGLDQDSFDVVRRTRTIHLENAHPSPEPQRNMVVGFTAPISGPGEDFRRVVATRVPLENLRTVFEQEGRLRYGDIPYDWLLLDREGAVLGEKNRPTDLHGDPVKLVLTS